MKSSLFKFLLLNFNLIILSSNLIGQKNMVVKANFHEYLCLTFILVPSNQDLKTSIEKKVATINVKTDEQAIEECGKVLKKYLKNDNFACDEVSYVVYNKKNGHVYRFPCENSDDNVKIKIKGTQMSRASTNFLDFGSLEGYLKKPVLVMESLHWNFSKLIQPTDSIVLITCDGESFLQNEMGRLTIDLSNDSLYKSEGYKTQITVLSKEDPLFHFQGSFYFPSIQELNQIHDFSLSLSIDSSISQNTKESIIHSYLSLNYPEYRIDDHLVSRLISLK